MIKCCCVCGGQVPNRISSESDSGFSSSDEEGSEACRVSYCNNKCRRDATMMRLEGVSIGDLQRRSQEIHSYIQKIERPDTKLFVTPLPAPSRQQRLNALDAAILEASNLSVSPQLLSPFDIQANNRKPSLNSAALQRCHSKAAASRVDSSGLHQTALTAFGSNLSRNPSATIPLSALRGHALARKPTPPAPLPLSLMHPPSFNVVQADNLSRPWVQAAPNRSPTYPLFAVKPRKLRRSNPVETQTENNVNQHMAFTSSELLSHSTGRQTLESVELLPPRRAWNDLPQSPKSTTSFVYSNLKVDQGFLDAASR